MRTHALEKHPKVVKGRSWRQRAQADKFRNTLAITSTAGTAPSSSWWTEPKTRAAFDARAAKERDRMVQSTSGGRAKAAVDIE